MAIKPILMRDWEVRAILDGRKSQTRREITLRRYRGFSEFGPSDTVGYDWHLRDSSKRWHDLRHAELLRLLPYSEGDLLWCREAWNLFNFSRDGECAWPTGRIPTAEEWRLDTQLDANRFTEIRYREATGMELEGQPWRSPMNMPKWASRITLRVTDVRIERLQDINGDALREEGLDIPPGPPLSPRETEYWKPTFADLWNSLHGPNAWGKNPWVAAITFEAIQKNVAEALDEIDRAKARETLKGVDDE